METVARYGDYSPRSYLKMVREPDNITVICCIDKEREFGAPNPRFCGAMAGGRSRHTYQVLCQLYDKLPTDHRKRAFIPSDRNDGSCLFIIRNDDISISTEDSLGNFSARVFVKRHPTPVIGVEPFNILLELFQAINADNKAEPSRNASTNC